MTQLEQLKADFAQSTEEFARRIAALEAQEEPELKDGDECWDFHANGEIAPSRYAEGYMGHQFPFTPSGKLRAERVGKRFRAMKEPAKEPFERGEDVWFVNGDGSDVYSSPWDTGTWHRLRYRLGMVHKTKAEAESWLAENRDAFWGDWSSEVKE